MNIDLARWQFAFTTINHFFFVPVTIGLAFLTALLQTWWNRNKNPDLLRLTRFFGTLLLASDGLAVTPLVIVAVVVAYVAAARIAPAPSAESAGQAPAGSAAAAGPAAAPGPSVTPGR